MHALLVGRGCKKGANFQFFKFSSLLFVIVFSKMFIFSQIFILIQLLFVTKPWV